MLSMTPVSHVMSIGICSIHLLNNGAPCLYLESSSASFGNSLNDSFSQLLVYLQGDEWGDDEIRVMCEKWV